LDRLAYKIGTTLIFYLPVDITTDTGTVKIDLYLKVVFFQIKYNDILLFFLNLSFPSGRAGRQDGSDSDDCHQGSGHIS
jgi:hypothetical protein